MNGEDDVIEDETFYTHQFIDAFLKKQEADKKPLTGMDAIVGHKRAIEPIKERARYTNYETKGGDQNG